MSSRTMAPRKKAQVAFLSAVVLLFLSGLFTYFVVARLMASEKWEVHSIEVRAALGDIDSAIANAGRARSGYMISQTDDFLNQFDKAVPEISNRFQHLRELTRDNPGQLDLCSRLQTVTNQRIALLAQSIALKKRAPDDHQGQADLDRQGVSLSSQMTSLTAQMRSEEQRLFDLRERTTHRLFVLTVVTLAIVFVVALELLAVHYRLLATELQRREDAEQMARNSEDSLRRLTARLLELQDVERRKFSRELHDSLGQYLVGVKMNLEMFATRRNEDLLAEAIRLLDQSIAETRTISHLLHPPLLDEAGLSSAAKWYLEGFAQRSGIAVSVDLPDDASRLPKPIALALFRVLQESLTNIHRHSNSSKADVTLRLQSNQVVLQIRDYGKGISSDMLDNFRAEGTKSGVGLAGMRERIRELGGQLRIQLASPGTQVNVTMPLPVRSASASLNAAD